MTPVLTILDGVLVIIDAVDGIPTQVQTVLRKAMQQKVKPVFMINQIDKSILELELNGEAIYQKFLKLIDTANNVISIF